MPESVFGLPVHPLAVHATVVLVPLAALALLAHVLVPAARQRLGIVTPVLAVVALVLVPISTSSGEESSTGSPRAASSTGTPSWPTGCSRGRWRLR